MVCESCVHWRPSPDIGGTIDDVTVNWDLYPEADYDAKRIPEIVAAVDAQRDLRWGKCGKITHGWGGAERAYTMDASLYQSSLVCREDFGCIEHEVRA